MALSIKTFAQYVRDMSAAVQGASAQILDLSVGSVIRAILEANASVALWLQVLIVDVMAASRAATAQGADLDSWMADFSIQRLPATPAVGLATFSRFSALGTALIPSGAAVRTTSGGVTFRVVRDISHELWDEARTAYVVPESQQDATVPIRAEVDGIGGNVLAGSITLIASSLAGVDSVLNVGPTAGGLDAEPDSALRLRFVDYINSRSRGTANAVAGAVASVRQGLAFTLQENIDSAGDTRPGHFVVTIDDGSGEPPLDLISSVMTAIDHVRPIGSTFSVHPPQVTLVNVALSVALPDLGASAANRVREVVAGAVERYVSSLGIGSGLSITRIAQVAYEASSDVRNVSGVSINGNDSDLSPGVREVIKPGMVAVS
jgi:uncharacterized phage protein gp47/JayE